MADATTLHKQCNTTTAHYYTSQQSSSQQGFVADTRQMRLLYTNNVTPQQQLIDNIITSSFDPITINSFFPFQERLQRSYNDAVKLKIRMRPEME